MTNTQNTPEYQVQIMRDGQWITVAGFACWADAKTRIETYREQGCTVRMVTTEGE